MKLRHGGMAEINAWKTPQRLTLFVMPYPAKMHAATIVRAALKLVEAPGAEGLSMRRLAIALGVRPSSLYNHFPDRAALEKALAPQAARLLARALPPEGSSDEAIGRAFLSFAQERPGLYELASRVENLEELGAWASGAPGRAMAALLRGYASLQRCREVPEAEWVAALRALRRGFADKGNIL
jgi:AcrR family transcriptional regulator